MARKSYTTAADEEAKAEIKTAKVTALADSQTWEAEENENPFDIAHRAKIEEIRTNKNGVVYVKFLDFHPKHTDVKGEFSYLTEAEFRAAYPRLIK